MNDFCSIQHPCGHQSSFDAGCLSTDVFRCPECGLRWRMNQAPPTVYPNGWVQPGKRTVAIDPQSELALERGAR